MMRQLSTRHAFLLATCLAIVPVAQAELRQCDSLSSNPGAYKVVLDEFAFGSDAAKANESLARLHETLQFNFEVQVDALNQAAQEINKKLKVPMRVVFCKQRQPSFDGSDFTAQLAERLSDERVVVEMWGRLDLRPPVTPDGKPAPSARIAYMMPPVHHYLDEDEVPPMHVLAYPKVGTAKSIEELENLPELPAFALVGLGTKAAKAKQYDLATFAFNQAEAKIASAKLAGTNARLDALLAYVKRATCETRASAKSDQNYTGSLKLVPACGGET
jgi:hypothetical protein